MDDFVFVRFRAPELGVIGGCVNVNGCEADENLTVRGIATFVAGRLAISQDFAGGSSARVVFVVRFLIGISLFARRSLGFKTLRMLPKAFLLSATGKLMCRLG